MSAAEIVAYVVGGVVLLVLVLLAQRMSCRADRAQADADADAELTRRMSAWRREGEAKRTRPRPASPIEGE